MSTKRDFISMILVLTMVNLPIVSKAKTRLLGDYTSLNSRVLLKQQGVKKVSEEITLKDDLNGYFYSLFRYYEFNELGLLEKIYDVDEYADTFIYEKRVYSRKNERLHCVRWVNSQIMIKVGHSALGLIKKDVPIMKIIKADSFYLNIIPTDNGAWKEHTFHYTYNSESNKLDFLVLKRYLEIEEIKDSIYGNVRRSVEYIDSSGNNKLRSVLYTDNRSVPIFQLSYGSVDDDVYKGVMRFNEINFDFLRLDSTYKRQKYMLAPINYLINKNRIDEYDRYIDSPIIVGGMDYVLRSKRIYYSIQRTYVNETVSHFEYQVSIRADRFELIRYAYLTKWDEREELEDYVEHLEVPKSEIPDKLEYYIKKEITLE
jgi:hypothetical protein